MPKKVDHDEQRRRIAEALWRIVARGGLEAVSMRDVAAEAGLSSAQHYFASKDELLRYALEHMVERSTQRIQRRIADAGELAPPRAVLKDVIAEILLSEEQYRDQARVWAGYLAKATVEPRVAELYQRVYTELGDIIAGLLAAAKRDGDAPPDLDPHRAAAGLLALADGLTMHVLVGLRTHEEALAALVDRLDGLLRDPGS
ncbi:MAG TPA: TetR family transcriptional regulator C-terminal domain-containing protein [Pseudonocardia sp.]|jgi:AcrR family transcriptional regulator|uniref:TetR/AcrR family transcriptional regulator n=1 Tax=Pseudonocardia sp. TaxID=60912 RepID=UPI002B4AE7D4|nr:TetR family transcriptional regulator C-terminal domain-containing protein [Pseudonocardia sp.]HLU55445.1 TetR family transcriptional regulator C-terminal domain-containing protein [Pseudonocardia sp.]